MKSKTFIAMVGLVFLCACVTRKAGNESNGGTGTSGDSSQRSNDASADSEGTGTTGTDGSADATDDPPIDVGLNDVAEDVGTDTGPQDTITVTKPDTTPGKQCDDESGPKCNGSDLCINGYCAGLCSPQAAKHRGIGCDYVAVQLPNPEAESSGIKVGVSNPSGVDELIVKIRATVDGDVLETITVSPKDSKEVLLPNRALSGTAKDKLAFHLTSDSPFVAWQLSPGGGASYSQDMTRLLPFGASGREYIAVTGKHNGFITVVGTTDNTLVSVLPKGAVQAGPGIKSLESEVLYTFELERGDTLNLSSSEQDLTGSLVLATEPIAVFAGSGLSRSGTRCCADHLEHQLPPVTAWGNTVIAQRSIPRGKAKDYWRILAALDETQVSFQSVGEAPPTVTLNRGQWVEVKSDKSLLVTGDKPIMVAQILASAQEAISQGDYCKVNADCPAGQECVQGKALNSPATCRAKCTVKQSNCPKQVYGCHELYGEAENLKPGEGLCYRNLCNPGDPPCAVGAVCVKGEQSAACYEPCSVADGCKDKDKTGEWCGTLSGQAVCAAKSCATDIESCPENAQCEQFASGNHTCRYKCTPAPSCPDPDYRCLSDRFYPGAKKWFDGAICVAPRCFSGEDCPDAHGCLLTAGGSGQCKPLGDPSLMIATPVEQYSEQHVIFVPPGHSKNYLNIVAPIDANVLVDGTAIPSGKYFPLAEEYKVVTKNVAPGTHRILSNQPVGVTVYGYGLEVSYGSQGGSNLSTLWLGTLGGGQTTNPEIDDKSDAGSVEQDENPEVVTPKVTWQTDIRPLVKVACQPCHIGTGSSGGLNMDTPDFVKLPSVKCNGKSMGEAFLLTLTPDNECGILMPPDGNLLSDDKVQMVQEWVDAGYP